MSLNWSAFFGWRGCADTELRFDDFFFDDHTVVMRFMPQYPNAYAGPVVAENGGGTYFVGQGDYRSGQDGPKLLLGVGAQQKLFNTSSLAAGKWLTAAVVRSGDVFKFYVGTFHAEPDLLIDPADPQLPTPASTIRMGRRTDGQMVNGQEAQFYGFVDDVVVFRGALTAGQLEDMIGTIQQLDADAVDGKMLAGWTFDDSTPAGDPLPPPLQAPVSFTSLVPGVTSAGKTLLASPPDDSIDGMIMATGLGPFQQVSDRLPFKYGQAWEVTQGINTQGGSHNGFAAFSLDLKLAKQGVNTGLEGASPTSCDQPVFSVADGDVREAYDDGDKGLIGGQDPRDGHNVLRVEQAPGEVVSYMHLRTDSIDEAFPDAGALPPGGASFAVKKRQRVAKVGTRAADNCHLHFGARNTWEDPAVNPAGGGVTFPLAFTGYEVSTDEGAHWSPVKRGIPNAGEWIRLPLPPECLQLRAEIASLEHEKRSLGDDFKQAGPSEKPAITAMINKIRAKIRDLKKKAAALGCEL